jgi:hypothetical protein
MNLQGISNSAFRIIDLCHQIASGEYSEKGEARREREIMRLIGQMQIEAEADERVQAYLDEKYSQEVDGE